MKHQINSFKCAFRGLKYALISESHMRFHFIAGFYVILFSFFYDFDAAQWGVILLLISSVITAEAFNTALEELCNLDTDSYSPLARVAKDVAAGAVLVLSAAAVVIGIIFYFKPAVLAAIWGFFKKNIWAAALLAVSLAVNAVFIKLGPNGIKAALNRRHNKKM